MALNPLFMTGFELEDAFLDKDTGQPLAFGTVSFFEDSSRTTPKDVYTLTGDSSGNLDYSYELLPNPITLSSIGTISDQLGNNVPIYYFPYDSNGNIQLYYIVVKNALGVVQLTREGWPNVTAQTAPPVPPYTVINQLSNPQFVDVAFLANNPLTISWSGSTTTTVAIAPNWSLVVTSTGTGSLQVQRNAIVGSTQYPGNPPYTLTITPGANVNTISLNQILSNNPDIFAPAAGGDNGWLAGSVLLSNNSSLSMTYQPNGQAVQTLLTANNTTGYPAVYNGTLQLSAANNANNADTGYVTISLVLPANTATTLGNVQLVGLESDIANVGYSQITANRQKDQLFHYYGPLLAAKPVKSYLVGWDFPLNPAQFLGYSHAAFSTGANTSNYICDQTILYQSADSGIAFSFAASGALTLTATNTTQFALVQYLPTYIARKLLNGALSANVSALTAQLGGLVGTVSLWYTSNASLPSTAANSSIVGTLTASGYPATFNHAGGAGWTEVTRNGLGNAQFTVLNTPNTTNYNNYGFSGWDANGVAGVNTATYFAIVVGFGSLTASNSVQINSISLVPGNIPTLPAPQTQDEVLRECQAYYEMSFNLGLVPAAAAGLGNGETYFPSYVYVRGAGGSPFLAAYIPYKSTKQAVPTTITTYSPVTAASAQIYNINSSGHDCTGTTTVGSSTYGFGLTITDLSSGSAGGDTCCVNWTSDARLGL